MTRIRRVGIRFWVELGLASVSTALLLVTVLWSEWIEIVFGVNPDEGSGALEWLLVVGFFSVTIACAVGARIEWRHAERARG